MQEKREVTPERKTNFVLLILHGKPSRIWGKDGHMIIIKADYYISVPIITRDKHAPYINASHTASIIIVSFGAQAWELRPCVCFPPPPQIDIGKTFGIPHFAISLFVSQHCFRKLWTILTKRIRWNQNSNMHLASYLGAFFGNYTQLQKKRTTYMHLL